MANLAEIIRAQAGRDPAALRKSPAPRFEVVGGSVVTRTGGVSRREAMQIPAARMATEIICQTIGTMGVSRRRGDDAISRGVLLTQPDPDCPYYATFAPLISDLIWLGRAYLIVLAHDGISTERNPLGFPVRARHVPAEMVLPDIDPDLAAYTRVRGYNVNGKYVAPEYVIAFSTGRPGVLEEGQSALRAAYELAEKSKRAYSTDLPAGVLTNTGPSLSAEEARAVLDQFSESRKTNSVALLQSMTYTAFSGTSAHDMELSAAAADSATLIARLFGLPAAMLNASNSGSGAGLYYQTVSANWASAVRQSMTGYIACLEQTFSAPNVSPLGTSVNWDVAGMLRATPQEMTDYVNALLEKGVITTEEARGFMGIPASGIPNDPSPGVV